MRFSAVFNKWVGQQVGRSPMNRLISLFLLLASLIALTSSKPTMAHDFHTSLTEVNYNPKTQSLEITIRVFTDDFERALTDINSNKPVNIKPTDLSTHPLILKYLRQHFALISPEKKPLLYDFLGKEIELDATWLYIEIPNATNLRGYTIRNSILTELFDDQTNLLNLIYPDKKKSFVFDTKTKSAVYPF